MAEYIIDKIEYGGNVYKLQDNVSDFLTGAVTSLSTTAGEHSTITNQNGAVSIAIPTNTSHLTNDSSFVQQFKVTITESNDTFSADKTFTEIQTAYNNGYEVICQGPTGSMIPVLEINSNNALFELSAMTVTGIPAAEIVTISSTNEVTHQFLNFTETDPVFSASPAAGITATDITNWNAKSDFSGNYIDLTNKPTNVSSFTNDSGYITASDITGKADKTTTVSTISWDSTNKKITKTINGTTSDVVSLIAGDNITLTPTASGLTITASGGQEAYVSKLESSYTTTTSSTTTVPIGINNFGAYDMLFVDINGLDLIQGTDYTISGQNIVLTTPITTVDTVVHFTVIRLVVMSSTDYSQLKGDTGDAAGFGTPTATVNNTVGTPGVTITSSGPNTEKVFNFAFTNLKGNTGEAAGFGTPTATVDNTVGTPGVTVTASGANTAKVFNFAFTNLKGEKGDKGEDGVDGTHSISYTSTIASGQQAGVLTIDGVSTPIYANVVWG